MSDVTDADREKARDVLASYSIGTPTNLNETIAQALADERAKALAPVLALAQAWRDRGDWIEAQLIRRAAGRQQ